MKSTHEQLVNPCMAVLWFSSREELVAEQLRSSRLQADLSSGAQETLSAQGERERLGLEVQNLQQRLQLKEQELLLTQRSSGGSGRSGDDQVHAQSTSILSYYM